MRGPTFSQFSADGASEDSTFGTQTLLAMRKFLDEAEICSQQGMSSNQVTKKVTNDGSAERKGEDSAENGCRQIEATEEVIRAFRTLLCGCEEQWS